MGANCLRQVDAAYAFSASIAANGLLQVDAAYGSAAPKSICRGGMGEAQRNPPRHSVEACSILGAPPGVSDHLQSLRSSVYRISDSPREALPEPPSADFPDIDFFLFFGENNVLRRKPI